jgi:hypothetical protein
MDNKKVAIVGYSLTLNQAPFDDLSWDIWGMNMPFHRLKRFTKWFDVHDKNIMYRHESYFNFLQANQENIYIADKVPELPNANLYPYQKITEKYGTFFTCSVSWMIALAIEQGYDEIALYGIDLNCKDEYKEQRPSVLYFLGIAQGKGIKITLPRECQLFNKLGMYWLNER